MKFDAIVIGAGLSGLVATAEIADRGKKVLLLDQEPESSFGGQAWWSFGGLFLIDSPEQRRMGIVTRMNWLGRIGSVQRTLIVMKKIIGGKNGQKRTWILLRVKNAHGYVRWVSNSFRSSAGLNEVVD